MVETPASVRFVDHGALGACVHCGLCLASCPTYVELGEEADSPRGRIYLMSALEYGRLAPSREVTRHLDLCLGCRACETACPSGVRYGSLIEAARPYVEAHRPPVARWGRRALARVLTSPRLGTSLFAALRLLGGRRWLGGLARRVPAGPGAWMALAAAMPPRRRMPRLPAELLPEGQVRGTAVLLTGCSAAALFPSTAFAAARLLQRAGLRVVVPPRQRCCGALALHLGDAAGARTLARHTTALLDGGPVDWVVTTAAGCGALVREYDHLLVDQPSASAVARRARDALDLLAELGLPPPIRSLARSVTVHDPCHLAHGQGVRTATRTLLAAVPGVRLVELEEADVCCGSAGTYNLTQPRMARRLLGRKLDHVAATGAEVVAAANPGCLLQIRAGVIARGLPIEVEHPLDLLAVAHDVA
jgi:glycolate dehydrogenase iron-sulfur subunit